MYNWLYFIVTSWLLRWKANSTKMSIELFYNSILAFIIVPLLGIFFNPNFCSDLLPILFSVDILTCMNFVNWFCLHFEKFQCCILNWNIVDQFFSIVKNCSLYFFISRSNSISASSFNWMTSFIAFCLSCLFFKFYLLFSSVLLTSNVAETNGLIIFLVASNISLFHN